MGSLECLIVVGLKRAGKLQILPPIVLELNSFFLCENHFGANIAEAPGLMLEEKEWVL